MNHHNILKTNGNMTNISRARVVKDVKAESRVSGIYTISFKLRLFVGYSTDLHRERKRLLSCDNGIAYDLLCCGGTYRILEEVEINTSIKELTRLRDSYVEWFTESLEDRRVLY